MGLKLKNIQKKNTIKKNEKSLKLNLDNIKCEKTLKEMTQYEIMFLFNRLSVLAKEHDLIPVVRDIKITYEPIEQVNMEG